MSQTANNAGGRLRQRAAELAAPMPPLLAEAERIASAVLLGDHGRRRVGTGDEFWQFRPRVDSDDPRSIDWRRSAKSDMHFVRQKEWQIVQSIAIWADRSRSMYYSSSNALPKKADRANLLALALSMLLLRGGERVGLADAAVPPRTGEVQLARIAATLSQTEEEGSADYGVPSLTGLRPDGRAVFVSDFMGDIEATRRALSDAADRRVRGVLLQVLDPEEEAFSFRGRTIFESVGGSLKHETLKAADLRARYLDRLQERKEALRDISRATGWLYSCHHTNQPASQALLWLYQALGKRP